MTAIKAHAIDRFLRRPDASITAFLVYGPDRGLVSERGRILLSQFATNPDDPFSVSVLDEAEIGKSADPLLEELNAIAFGTDKRTVVLRCSSGTPPLALVAAVKAPREAILIVEAGDLKPTSAIRKAFEAANNAAALPCYADTAAGLAELIKTSLAEMNQTITSEAAEALRTRLGADRLASRAEIEKLMLYAGRGADIQLEDVDASTADAGELTMDALIDAVGEGKLREIEDASERTLEAGISEAQILATTIRHFLRLHESVVQMGKGQSAERAISGLRPPVFFRRKDSHLRQMRRWTEGALRQALKLLSKAEIDGRIGKTPSASTSRTMLQLARLPRPTRH